MEDLPLQILSVLISTFVVMTGWIVAHDFNLKRDTLAKRRELRTKYLLEAYRRLENSCGRIGSLTEAYSAFESAAADIQLLGTCKQIEELLKFLETFKDNTSGSIDKVLSLIRDELRIELDLEYVVKPIHQFRFKGNVFEKLEI